MRTALPLVLASLFLPTALADPPKCSDVTDAPPNPLGVYVYGDPFRGLEVWLESNDSPGLQRQACLRENGTLARPDTLVTGTFAL